MAGFYVPDSMSSSYVANKRNSQGSLAYEAASAEVGLQKQAAFQQLEKNYAATIENAYASYLAGNRGIEGSQMGQGYKELYKQAQQSQLQQNMANANLDVAQQMQSISSSEEQAQASIQQQFATEVGYFDRVAASMADYFEYAKGLTQYESGETYLTLEEMQQGVDSMYDILYSIKPQSYLDAEGNIGMSYAEYMRSKIGTTAAETAFSQWLFSGGLSEFMSMPKKYAQWKPGESLARQQAAEAEAAKAEKEKDSEDAMTKTVKSLAGR